MNDSHTANQRKQFLRLLAKVVIIVGSLCATLAALLGLLATRSKLLMGVLGFDGFIAWQTEQGITPIDRYGGMPHKLIVYVLLIATIALSAAIVRATWRTARNQPLSPTLRNLTDIGHGCMWGVLATGLLAALLHIGGGWETLIYNRNDELISHYMMQVRPPRYERIALMLVVSAIIAGSFAWALRRTAPDPRIVTDLTRRTLLVLAVGVAMHIASLFGPIDRTTGIFTTAALSTLAVFWALGTFGLQSIAIPLARQKFPDNHCQSCGYNLHGTVSDACPECGEVIESRT